MIKRLALCIALLLSVSLVHAASMSLATVGGGFAKTGSTYSVKGATATAANGAFITPATVTASGKLVAMSGTATIAANAAQFVVAAVRLNPAGLMVSLTVSWLLSKGLSYVNGQWVHTDANYYWSDASNLTGIHAGSYTEYMTQRCAAQYGSGSYTLYPTLGNGPSTYGFYCNAGGDGQAAGKHCVNGGGLTQEGECSGASGVPATEQDFTNAGQGVVPDNVAQELARADVPIPVNASVLSPATVSDGDPYLDPLTGRMVQREIQVRPAPTAENPLRVEITEIVKDAGAVPGQTGEPVATTKEIVFPSDYARQGEAQAAADSINLKLDKMLETSPAPADPVTPDPGGYTDFGTTFQGLLGWQLPGHTSQCPTASFTAPWATSYTIDSHCQLITSHWSALQAAMAVVWTIVALFIVLRA